MGKTRNKVIALTIVCLLLVLAGAVWTWQGARVATAQNAAPTQGNPLFPPEMNAAAIAKGDVIGDLGGVKVRIPAHFANYVEYDGDPGFGEKRQGPVPRRTFESKLMSFGFEVRFPDMAGRTSPELWQDYKSKLPRESQWMHVGFNTGSIYPGDGFLDRYTDRTINFKAGERFSGLEYEEYEKLPQLEFGLTVYAPPGIDRKTGKPLREHKSAKDLYVLRDARGRVLTVIQCDNRWTNPDCSHDFSMEPTMKAAISVRYRRGLLPHWKEIQTNVSQLIAGFAVNADSAQPAQAR